MGTETSTTAGILLTDNAASKVAALLAQEGRDDLNLRVAVQPGGCSGLKYQLYFDDRNLEGDIVREFGSVKRIGFFKYRERGRGRQVSPCGIELIRA